MRGDWCPAPRHGGCSSIWTATPGGAEHHPSTLCQGRIRRGAQPSRTALTPPSPPPLPQTIPSTSPRSPFSPATTPAAASGSRTPCSWWCRSSGRSWPRSTDAEVPGSGSVGKEQPGDGSQPPRVAFQPRLLRQRDRAQGGRRRGGIGAAGKKLTRVLPLPEVPVLVRHPCRGIMPGSVKGCAAGRIPAAPAEGSGPRAVAQPVPAHPIGCCFLHF